MSTSRRVGWHRSSVLLTLLAMTACSSQQASSMSSSEVLSAPAGKHIAPGTMLEHLRRECRRHHSASVSADLQSAGQTLHATADLRWDSGVSGVLKVDLAGLRYEAVVKDGDTYVASPERADSFALSDPAKAVLGVEIVPQLNPCQVTQSLLGEVDDVRYIGDQQVAGRTLRRYRLILPAADPTVPQGQTKEPPAPDESLETGYSLWLDRAGLLRRLSSGSADGDSSLQLTVLKYDVDVRLPRMGRVEYPLSIVNRSG